MGDPGCRGLMALKEEALVPDSFGRITRFCYAVQNHPPRLGIIRLALTKLVMLHKRDYWSGGILSRRLDLHAWHFHKGKYRSQQPKPIWTEGQFISVPHPNTSWETRDTVSILVQPPLTLFMRASEDLHTPEIFRQTVHM